MVELRVDASQAEWVRSLAGEETVAGTSPDGWVDFKLPVTNRAAFRSFVLGLLDRAEVMGPPEVRDEIIYWLAALRSGPDQAQAGREPGRPRRRSMSPSDEQLHEHSATPGRSGAAGDREPAQRRRAARTAAGHRAVGGGPGRARPSARPASASASRSVT